MDYYKWKLNEIVKKILYETCRRELLIVKLLYRCAIIKVCSKSIIK